MKVPMKNNFVLSLLAVQFNYCKENNFEEHKKKVTNLILEEMARQQYTLKEVRSWFRRTLNIRAV